MKLLAQEGDVAGACVAGPGHQLTRSCFWMLGKRKIGEQVSHRAGVGFLINNSAPCGVQHLLFG